MDCSPPGSSVHAILQARILEWVVISYSRDSFPIQGSNLNFLSPTLAGGFFISSTTCEAPNWSLPRYKHRPFLHLCIFLFCSPEFCSFPHIALMHILLLIAKYFIFMMLIRMALCLISNFTWSLLSKKAIDFCILMLYSATLLQSLHSRRLFFFFFLLFFLLIFFTCAQLFGSVWLFEAPWTVAHWVPLSRRFSRQLEWFAIHSSMGSSHPGIKPASHVFLHWQADSLSLAQPRKPKFLHRQGFEFFTINHKVRFYWIYSLSSWRRSYIFLIYWVFLIMDECWIFVRCFFCLCWHDYVIFYSLACCYDWLHYLIFKRWCSLAYLG